jgi:hypothetical protein
MRHNASVPLWLAAVVLAALVMLPRLASPQFGLLDDGFMLRAGSQIVGNPSTVLHLMPDTGRFFPAYWLTRAAVFGLVGPRPLAFFVVNVLVFSVLLAVLGRVIVLGGGGWPHVCVALILFAVSGPAVESFYTLSKAEPLQLMWIGVSLLATMRASLSTSRLVRAGLIAVGFVTLILLYATKETSVVMIPISLGWLALEARRDRACGRFAGTYALLNVAAAVVFAGLRWHSAPLPLGQGWYTRAYSVDMATIGMALFRVSAWLIRDFAFLLPLLAVGCWLLMGDPVASRRLLISAGLWMAGWLIVYLPWPVTFEYFLLPFAFGCAAWGGAVVGKMWDLACDGSSTGRLVAWSVLIATTVLWGLTCVNAIADARIQLSVDRANADLVEFLAGVPTHSRIVINVAYANEYVYELPLHLADVKQRPDLSVTYGASALSAPTPAATVFVVTPEIAHQPAPTVRIAPHEPPAQSIAGSPGSLGSRGALVYRGHQQTRVLELGVHRMLCRLKTGPFFDATYCPTDRGIVFWRMFSYGWQVHQLDLRRQTQVPPDLLIYDERPRRSAIPASSFPAFSVGPISLE